jgi:hypothetical protein
MSTSAIANVVGQALSIAQLGAAKWRSMEEAEMALHAFSTAQGWSLITRNSGKHHFKLRDALGEERPGEGIQYKVWLCSRGHQRQTNEPHVCADSGTVSQRATAAAASGSAEDTRSEDVAACESINSTGQLGAPCPARPHLPASAKTGCPVTVRVTMLRKEKPENGSHWTEQDTPCAGYTLVTPAKLLLPCQHNHSTRNSARALTESASHIAPTVRDEIKAYVLANFPSYRIRTFISQKHQLPPMTPAVWSTLIRSIKIELGIHDAGEDLQALVARLTQERNESGAVFDMSVDGDMTVSAIFFMSRAMVASFHRCAQFVVMDSTCKTNRFGMSLFLVCGVDEHMHIALYATALMKDETQPAFEYVLKQLRRAVGLDAWMRMACVATDGCAAMTAALTKEAPHTVQQRCVWHLQQNIIKHTGASHQHIIRAWYTCVYAKSAEEFDAKWTELLRTKMSEKCCEYLTKYIYPLRAKWAGYATGQLTNFGSHSTQLVESLNRLLKMWDVNDKTSLSRALERICTVKEEEETRRQITAMKDNSMRALIAGPAAQIQIHDTYKAKVSKLLTHAAARLCTEQYDLYSQYHVSLHAPTAGDVFSLATQVYIVKHKAGQTASCSEHQVHVSSHLIYCPCGFVTAYLLPCRHVLAANGAAFTDIFQAGQYHPRWQLHYSNIMQRELLLKQFWLSVGHEVTSDGLKRVQGRIKSAAEQAEEEDKEGGEGSAAAAAASPATSSAGESSLPHPMYPSASLELLPALMSPQQLYHMIEGECASLRQLACADPARLSGLVWMELHQAKLRITQHIDREQRMQQQQVVAASAAVAGGLTSEGFPLAALLAPVPLTASKPGRPSSKRARAAVEGVAARQVRAMLPAHQQHMLAGGGQGGLQQQAATSSQVSSELHSSIVISPVTVASAAAAVSRAAAGMDGAAVSDAAAAGGQPEVRSLAAVSHPALSVSPLHAAASAGGAAAAAGGGGGAAAAAVVPLVSGRGRVLVRRAPFE